MEPTIPAQVPEDHVQKLDPWGNVLHVNTAKELKKLRKEIIDEGINKRAYSSEESDADDDSDNEMLMKFVTKKTKKNGKPDFDTVAYAFSLNNKVSSLRSELARTEERLRYLQLDYNNKEIKIEELNTKNLELRTVIVNLRKESKNHLTIIHNLENRFCYLEYLLLGIVFCIFIGLVCVYLYL